MSPSLSTKFYFIQLRLTIKQVARNLRELSVRGRHGNSPGGAEGETMIGGAIYSRGRLPGNFNRP
jgi:hypothetical protein